MEEVEKDIAILKDVVGSNKTMKKKLDKFKKPRF